MILNNFPGFWEDDLAQHQAVWEHRNVQVEAEIPGDFRGFQLFRFIDKNF